MQGDFVPHSPQPATQAAGHGAHDALPGNTGGALTRTRVKDGASGLLCPKGSTNTSQVLHRSHFHSHQSGAQL